MQMHFYVNIKMYVEIHKYIKRLNKFPVLVAIVCFGMKIPVVCIVFGFYFCVVCFCFVFLHFIDEYIVSSTSKMKHFKHKPSIIMSFNYLEKNVIAYKQQLLDVVVNVRVAVLSSLFYEVGAKFSLLSCVIYNENIIVVFPL